MYFSGEEVQARLKGIFKGKHTWGEFSTMSSDHPEGSASLPPNLEEECLVFGVGRGYH